MEMKDRYYKIYVLALYRKITFMRAFRRSEKNGMWEKWKERYSIDFSKFSYQQGYPQRWTLRWQYAQRGYSTEGDKCVWDRVSE